MKRETSDPANVPTHNPLCLSRNNVPKDHRTADITGHDEVIVVMIRRQSHLRRLAFPLGDHLSLVQVPDVDRLVGAYRQFAFQSLMS